MMTLAVQPSSTQWPTPSSDDHIPPVSRPVSLLFVPSSAREHPFLLPPVPKTGNAVGIRVPTSPSGALVWHAVGSVYWPAVFLLPSQSRRRHADDEGSVVSAPLDARGHRCTHPAVVDWYLLGIDLVF